MPVAIQPTCATAKPLNRPGPVPWGILTPHFASFYDFLKGDAHIRSYVGGWPPLVFVNPMDNKSLLNIDVRKVLEVALLGVRRAAMFMGLGVNASENPAIVDYQIQGFKEIRLLPDNLPQEIIQESKLNFWQW